MVIMKSLLLDLIGLSGFGMLSYGLYLAYELPTCLMVSGGMLLLAAIIGQRSKV